jgi:ABC-type transporter Mla subunit MlaD
MRRVLAVLVLVLVVPAAVLFGAGAGDDQSGDYKVRGIFDNASFLIPGQDVKVAGAKVGSVEELDVHREGQRSFAAIVMKIDEDGFKDFRKDARCAIRLQSVIGEKLIECTPTQPTAPGEPPPPPLEKIPDGQPGAGQYLLPVESTVTPVDADLINNIQRRPVRQRFSILLNELGTGLAARAKDLKEVIHRANPAFREFDQFLNILANQNRMLRELTKNADTVLTALARKRRNVANFFVRSRVAAQATAEKRRDLERNFAKFPAFLRQLRPFMERFDALSSAMAPVISDLRVSAKDVSRFLVALGPFSRSSTLALNTLGDTADVGRPALVAAKPVADRLADFTSQGRRVVRNLRVLFESIQKRKGIERFMDVLFYVTLSTNGFDEIGHYLRNNLIVTICSGYSITPTVGCSANFAEEEEASATATSRASARSTARGLIELLGLSEKPDSGRADGRRAGSERESRSGGATPQKQSAPSEPTQPPSTPAPSPTRGQDPVIDYLLGGAK